MKKGRVMNCLISVLLMILTLFTSVSMVYAEDAEASQDQGLVSESKEDGEEVVDEAEDILDDDKEPAKDLERDARLEQQMKQILKDIGVGFAESDSESDSVSDDEPATQNAPRMERAARASGETISTGALKKNIGRIDVIDYNDPSWPQLMTWKEGKLGNTGTQEMLFCTNPMITFKAGTKTGVDASTIYNQKTIQTIVAMQYYYDHYMCKSINSDYEYLMKQCAVWWVLNEVNGWFKSGVRIETGNNVKCACGTWLSTHMSNYYDQGFQWVWSNYQYFTDAKGIIYQGNGQPLSKWWGTYNPSGYAKVKKTSSNANVTGSNSSYSLEGAEYSVYSDSACTSRVGTLKTGANGESNTLKLNAGTYYVKETKAPKGYALDSTAKSITVTSGNTATVSFSDQPQMARPDLLLSKVDAETAKNQPQGSATLKGAQFTVKFYDGNYTTDPKDSGKKPLRTWVFETDKDGYCKYDAKYKVSGDALYTTAKGISALPLGTVTIQETKAPEGYLLNSKVYVKQITASGTAETVKTYSQPIVPENILKLELVKVQEGTDIKIPGAVFEHTKPDGSKARLTTDQNGALTIKGLTHGVHKLQEISVMDGYVVNNNLVEFKVGTDNRITLTSKANDSVGKITFTVEKDGNVSMTVEDKLAPFKLQLKKENEKGTVLEGAEFTLYEDPECKQVVHKATTNAKGILSFENLTIGKKYYLVETKAPQGYRIPVSSKGETIVYEVSVTSTPVKDQFTFHVNGKDYNSDSDGMFTVTGTKADRIANMTIINTTGKKLPNTGSNQMLILLVAAFAAGAVVLMTKRR